MHALLIADNLKGNCIRRAGLDIAYPVSFSFRSGRSCLNSSHGICVIMPAPSPEISSAEQAPLCSIQLRAVTACARAELLLRRLLTCKHALGCLGNMGSLESKARHGLSNSACDAMGQDCTWLRILCILSCLRLAMKPTCRSTICYKLWTQQI